MMKIEDLKEYKGYVIITDYFEQYQWGVTGVHRFKSIILDNDKKPFKFKKDAIEFAKINGLKNSYTKGLPNEGYGSKGEKSFKVSYLKVSDLSEEHIYHDIKSNGKFI